MNARIYDKKTGNKRFGIKWGNWKKPSFKFFQLEDDRNEFLEKLQKKERIDGLAVLNVSTLEAQVMRKCVDLMGSAEAVLALCEREKGNLTLKEILTADAVKEYLDEKLNIGRDQNYLRAIRNILKRLHTAFPGKRPNEISLDDASRWIHSLNYAPITVKNHHKCASAFMNWCIRKQYCRENVFQTIPTADVIMPEPEFLSLDQFSAVMSNAVEFYPDAIAYISLQAFGGLRSSACARLDIQNINFKQNGILIRSDIAKNKRRIYIDGQPDCLWQWLAYARKHAPEGFSLTKRQYDQRKDQIAEKTGFRMPHNALRHSFCTYHVAMNGDAGKTATLLSHRGNVAILYEHYKGNATKEQGAEWFNLLPPDCP